MAMPITPSYTPPLNSFVGPYTTKEEFISNWQTVRHLRLNPYLEKSSLCPLTTPMHRAAKLGNVELIDFFALVGGTELLTLEDLCYQTPLKCAVSCEDAERGYLATKKLLQLGTPVNSCGSNNPSLIYRTPLESALMDGKIKIAALLIKMGGIVPWEHYKYEHLKDRGCDLQDEYVKTKYYSEKIKAAYEAAEKEAATMENLTLEMEAPSKI